MLRSSHSHGPRGQPPPACSRTSCHALQRSRKSAVCDDDDVDDDDRSTDVHVQLSEVSSGRCDSLTSTSPSARRASQIRTVAPKAKPRSNDGGDHNTSSLRAASASISRKNDRCRAREPPPAAAASRINIATPVTMPTSVDHRFLVRALASVRSNETEPYEDSLISEPVQILPRSATRLRARNSVNSIAC